MQRLTPIFAAFFAMATPAVAGETLAESLYSKAPVILQTLKKKDMTAVGVLKFTAVEDGKPADSLKELGFTLSVRTQTALLLANKDPGFVVIENPSQQVAMHPTLKVPLYEANQNTDAGRKAFFEMNYQPAFGKDEVEASGFIVGVAKPSADRSTLTLQLRVFDRSGKLTDLTDEWTVDLDPELLGEMGGSYALPPITRKAVVSGEPIQNEQIQKLVVETAVAVVPATTATPDAKPVPNPALENCPIKWEIRYNDKVQTVSGSLLPEPDEGDKVSFVLTNPSQDETYGVVLLVNGENTLYKERQAVAKCRKWILEPRTETVITGFQTGPNISAEFKVVHPEAPEAETVRYSENLGQFRLVVFAGKVTDTNPTPANGKSMDAVTAIADARLKYRPEGVRPESLESLQAKLLRDGRDTTNARGVVVGGPDAPSKTVQVWFAPVSNQPVADITLQYFHPKK